MSLFIVQPPIEGILAEFIIAFLTIAVGIFLENSGSSRKSIIFAAVGLIVTAITTSLDILVLPILLVYFFVGVLVAFFKVELVYGLFGSKVYGSLILSMAITHIPSFHEYLYNSLIMVSQASQLIILRDFYLLLLFMWLMLAITAWIIGKIIFKKKKRA